MAIEPYVNNMLISANKSYVPSYLYSVVFYDPKQIRPNEDPSLADVFREGLKYIIDDTFKIPTQSVGTYELLYSGTKIPKIKQKEETDKKITITIREVENYDVFNTFITKFYVQFNPINGIGMIEPLNMFDLHVLGYNREIEEVQSWKFQHCQILSVDPTEFNHSSGEAFKVNVEMVYMNMIPESIKRKKDINEMIEDYFSSFYI